MNDDYTINYHCLVIHLSLKGWGKLLFELGVKGLKMLKMSQASVGVKSRSMPQIKPPHLITGVGGENKITISQDCSNY